jgi:hypothetical protein
MGMATQGDTLSWVLLVVATGALGSAALGALILGGRELLRRWSASGRSPRETPTVVFRTPAPDDLADPTDRFGSPPLFEAQGAANDDPFEDDTVPFLDVERVDRTGTAADL